MDVLGITRNELAKCYGLEKDTALTLALLQNLAFRFGSEKPDADPDELVDFLNEKTTQYQEMLVELRRMKRGRLNNVASTIEHFLKDGEFSKAREALEQARQLNFENLIMPGLATNIEIDLVEIDLTFFASNEFVESETRIMAAVDLFDTYGALYGASLRQFLSTKTMKIYGAGGLNEILIRSMERFLASDISNQNALARGIVRTSLADLIVYRSGNGFDVMVATEFARAAELYEFALEDFAKAKVDRFVKHVQNNIALAYFAVSLLSEGTQAITALKNFSGVFSVLENGDPIKSEWFRAPFNIKNDTL